MPGPETQVRPRQIFLAANGSMIYRDATGKTVEFPAGAEQFVISILGGIPVWISTQDLPVNALDVFKYTLMR